MRAIAHHAKTATTAEHQAKNQTRQTGRNVHHVAAGKVECAKLLLDGLIVRQCPSREIEHQCEVTSQVGVQPLMLGYPTGQFRNWLNGRPQTRFRSLLGEFGPLAPGSSVTLQIEGKDLDQRKIGIGVFLATGQRDRLNVREGRLDRTQKLDIDILLSRFWKVTEKIVGIGLRKSGNPGEGNVVAAYLIDQ